jgi:hypothetical protein
MQDSQNFLSPNPTVRITAEISKTMPFPFCESWNPGMLLILSKSGAMSMADIRRQSGQDSQDEGFTEFSESQSNSPHYYRDFKNHAIPILLILESWNVVNPVKIWGDEHGRHPQAEWTGFTGCRIHRIF